MMVSVFLYSPACPENIQSNGLHYCGKSHSLHAAHPEMFHSGAAIEFGHGGLNPGSVPIFISELGAVLIPSSYGDADIFAAVAVIASLLAFAHRTTVEIFALTAGCRGKNSAESLLGFLHLLRGTALGTGDNPAIGIKRKVTELQFFLITRHNWRNDSDIMLIPGLFTIAVTAVQ